MSEEFAQQIIHQAVARACIALDFKTSYSSVVETLSDVVIKYIKDLAEETKEIAESSGRAVVGVQDVLRILTEKGPNIKELREFAIEDETSDSSNKWSYPFLGSVAKFPAPVVRDINMGKLQTEHGEEMDTNGSLPKHFPPLPPAHTYMQSDSAGKKRRRDSSNKSGKDGDRISDRAKLASSRRSVQKSLSRIEDAAERSAIDGSRHVVFKDTLSSSSAPKIPKVAPKNAKNDLTVNLNLVDQQVLEGLPRESRMLLGLENNM